MHLPSLIKDLALILLTAGMVSLLFRSLKQPIVLGYLLAGVLVGPHISIIPTVENTVNVRILGELGVIFLLFVLGLEFSFRKLFQVGKAVLVAATVEVILMTLIGFGMGKVLGWSSIDAIFLGGILAISSTTIIIKAFEAQGIKTQTFASLVFGILIIEDLFAVILLAVLSTLGVSRTLEGPALLKQVGVLALFLTVVIPVGLWVTPRFFKLIRARLDDEIRVIVSLGLCLALVVVSTSFGFSAALGAFLMGAFLGETYEGERMERFLKPIRDLFGAIFFTSVGMLVEVDQILHQFPLILLLSVVTIVGKALTTTIGAMLGGQDRRTALQAGLSLGQIGEFSFIIATLGLSLQVIRPEIYPLVVSMALVTTFATPYLVGIARRLQLNLHGKRRGTQVKKPEPRLWNGHLVELEIHPHFRQAGESLQELKLRERFGVSIVAIHRGDRRIIAPHRDVRLMPLDRVLILGEDAQLAAIEKFLYSERFAVGSSEEGEFGLRSIALAEAHSLVGKTLRESGIRESVHGIVLGVERKGKRVLNPDSQTCLEKGDILWIYGNREEIRTLARAL